MTNVVCVCVCYRMEGRNGRSSDLVRSGFDISGSGVLETSQHFTALQGLLRFHFEGLLGVKVFFLHIFVASLQVPDGATVTLVSRQSKQIHHDSHDYIPGESECG